MGYDMYWEEQPVDVAEAKAKWLETTQLFGFAEAKEAFDHYMKAEEEAESYFRLNIWGMGAMRDLLAAGGSLSWEASHPDFPSFEVWLEEDEPGYEEQSAAIAVATDSDTGGVLPAYKVSDNSGWLVTPTECMATALTWFEGGGRDQARAEAEEQAVKWSRDGEFATTDHVLHWADRFVEWMAAAAGHGGFRVW